LLQQVLIGQQVNDEYGYVRGVAEDFPQGPKTSYIHVSVFIKVVCFSNALELHLKWQTLISCKGSIREV